MRPPTPLTRHEDWPERLAALVEARRDTAFAWGAHDCALFAADGVAAVTGVDPAAPYRGTYADEAGADRLVADHGGFDLFMDAAFTRAGLVACPVEWAHRGDVCLVDYGNQRSMGVVLGGSVAVPGVNGLAFLPHRLVRRVWAV